MKISITIFRTITTGNVQVQEDIQGDFSEFKKFKEGMSMYYFEQFLERLREDFETKTEVTIEPTIKSPLAPLQAQIERPFTRRPF